MCSGVFLTTQGRSRTGNHAGSGAALEKSSSVHGVVDAPDADA
jgi:hypothetical protein